MTDRLTNYIIFQVSGGPSQKVEQAAYGRSLPLVWVTSRFFISKSEIWQIGRSKRICGSSTWLNISESSLKPIQQSNMLHCHDTEITGGNLDSQPNWGKVRGNVGRKLSLEQLEKTWHAQKKKTNAKLQSNDINNNIAEKKVMCSCSCSRPTSWRMWTEPQEGSGRVVREGGSRERENGCTQSTEALREKKKKRGAGRNE